jgi:hypothetical protein
MSHWIWTVLLAGVAISVAIVGRAIMLRRRGMPVPRGSWQLLALGWAGVLILGFLLVLLPENATSALFPIAFVVGGGATRRFEPPEPILERIGNLNCRRPQGIAR